MTEDKVQEARTADLFWRILRAQCVVAYTGAAVVMVMSVDTAAVALYLAAFVAVAVVGTVYMTRQAHQVLAPHRDPATRELSFDRLPLRLSHLLLLPSRTQER